MIDTTLTRRDLAVMAAASGGAFPAHNTVPKPLKSALKTPAAPTPQLGIGWEVGNMLNNGANIYSQLTRPIVITGVQLFASMAPTGKPSFGFCEVLVMVVTGPSVPTFFDPPHQYFSFPDVPSGTSDWKTPVVDNPNSMAINGSIGAGGTLASWILKSMSNQCVNENITRTNLSIAVPAGGVVLVHVDHYGTSGADFEIQGSVEYV